jgi:hypothetical protein
MNKGSTKYFNGQIELAHPHGMPNKQFESTFPGIKGRNYDSFSKFVAYVPGTKTIMPVERRIDFKSNPSLHQCDSRCMNAKGKSCECSCGGKNHGAGNFI